jgi:hypothetical protein
LAAFIKGVVRKVRWPVQTCNSCPQRTGFQCFTDDQPFEADEMEGITWEYTCLRQPGQAVDPDEYCRVVERCVDRRVAVPGDLTDPWQ